MIGGLFLNRQINGIKLRMQFIKIDPQIGKEGISSVRHKFLTFKNSGWLLIFLLVTSYNSKSNLLKSSLFTSKLIYVSKKDINETKLLFRAI